ncbi:uncharacterized protein CTRU02_204861 [Colletotrichum truncatum]|uniref:Uncharacterized protein n=1 Tax=Colletotrichum truncatum TaxID=5467 RepID=A0ACC3ZD94_COLTU|nr:uncharacterized protein CTRU02_03095 [Colletotrichum truncatum]KAF6798053.1 hypothetical protein CTRU02_03095 [Colletotrichum truncatum]
MSSMTLNEAQHRALGVNAAFIIFITIIMGMRMWARLVITKALGVDDIIMAVGTLATISLSITVMVSVVRGIGKMKADIPLEAWEPMLLSLWVARLIYAVAMLLVKVALLLFYLRLDNRPMMRVAVYSLMVVIFGMGIAHFVVSVIECSPPAVFWTSRGDRGVYMRQCMTQAMQQAFWDAAGILVIVTDICLWACPIPMIWGLQLPKRQKWVVSGIFAFGIISVVAGCVRFYYVRQLANEPELYRQLADSLIWYALELYVAIFCGCSSALKVFCKRYFPSLLGSSTSKTKYALDSYGNDGTRLRTTNAHPLVSLSKNVTGNHTTISSTGRKGRSEAGAPDCYRNDSEEAIMSSNQGIRMKTEVQQEVMRTSTDSENKNSRTETGDRTHAWSFVK